MTVRRSIVELCHADHQGDAPTLSAWLANKTTDNMRRWIAQRRVFIATEYGRVVGVCALKPPGEITLNYVSPDARFRGVTKALPRQAELEVSDLGAKTVMLQSSLTAFAFTAPPGIAALGRRSKDSASPPATRWRSCCNKSSRWRTASFAIARSRLSAKAVSRDHRES